jgi:transcriptional regulator with XRE-family HTH domain
VARLGGVSSDYYVELEQGRGPRPSAQVLMALGNALRLTPDELAYLFRLADHAPPETATPASPPAPAVDPCLGDLFPGLAATPAIIITDLHELLARNDLGTELLGARAIGPWPHGSLAYCWFTEPQARTCYPPEDHPRHSRVFVADLRASLARRGNDPVTAGRIAALRAESVEFDTLWRAREVAVRRSDRKRIVHPSQGVIEVVCHALATEDGRQRLIWFSPVPGTPAARQFRAIGVPQSA